MPHVLLQLISTDEQPFRSVDEVLVTDLTSGKVLGQLPYRTGPLWDAYLPLEPRFVSQPANIRVRALWYGMVSLFIVKLRKKP